MGDGRAREHGQWEPAGGGALPFKERRGTASGEPSAWGGAAFGRRATVSPQVSWGCAGRGGWGEACFLQGSARVGRGAGVIPPGWHGASGRPGFSPPQAVCGDPETRPPHRDRPVVAGSQRRCQLLTANLAPYGNSCEPRGLVRRKIGMGRGGGRAPSCSGKILRLFPSWRRRCRRLRSHPRPLFLGVSRGSPRQVQSGKPRSKNTVFMIFGKKMFSVEIFRKAQI